MDIQTRKIQFVQEFLKLKSEQAISKLEALLKEERSNTRVFSQEEFEQRIRQSEDDFKNNRFKTSEELKSKYQQ